MLNILTNSAKSALTRVSAAAALAFTPACAESYCELEAEKVASIIDEVQGDLRELKGRDSDPWLSKNCDELMPLMVKLRGQKVQVANACPQSPEDRVMLGTRLKEVNAEYKRICQPEKNTVDLDKEVDDAEKKGETEKKGEAGKKTPLQKSGSSVD